MVGYNLKNRFFSSIYFLKKRILLEYTHKYFELMDIFVQYIYNLANNGHEILLLCEFSYNVNSTVQIALSFGYLMIYNRL